MRTNYKDDFPLLKNSTAGGKPLVYLDNAATTQKPAQVIEAVKEYYEQYNANPHRGAYPLSEKATEVYEAAREKAAEFIGADSPEEIVFTKGTTESLNLVASSYGLDNIREGDEILISIEEHHSNLIPWQAVAKTRNARLRYLYTDENGKLPLEEISAKINARTKIVAVTQVSNVLGIVNPLGEIVRRAREVGAVVVLDAAQSIPHMPVDVRALDVDFLAFSGHKLYAPTGIGVLYGKKEHLRKMQPLLFGGGMVDDVSEQDATFAEGPSKFEGGTQNVEGAVGLHAAIDYLEGIGYERIGQIESELTQYALTRFHSIPHVTVYGKESGNNRAGIISFNIDGAHPHDVSTILSADNVAIRSGHHCAHPLMRHMGVNATCRVSLCFYNTRDDIDILIESICKVREVLGLELK
ncbi:cysteine desulfurase [Ruminiclostridium cellobioparum]|uniref:Cysteine desulfurase n=1 Tax=Ruminiclostridium cellobioparum subsp. termitidis CT1112 TaxID=1195236 RepID=S0FNI6_RUMCE|nr:cysteine desulfurase [Ruminiclostridium cellobioparum]EMS73442.1 cysteine desulfurase, SufS subfamily [Ruminiclostridium cellobioparum subsp. termitidis CT1112]